MHTVSINIYQDVNSTMENAQNIASIIRKYRYTSTL